VQATHEFSERRHLWYVMHCISRYHWLGIVRLSQIDASDDDTREFERRDVPKV